jgi:hypothetical protein
MHGSVALYRRDVSVSCRARKWRLRWSCDGGASSKATSNPHLRRVGDEIQTESRFGCATACLSFETWTNAVGGCSPSYHCDSECLLICLLQSVPECSRENDWARGTLRVIYLTSRWDRGRETYMKRTPKAASRTIICEPPCSYHE